MNIMKNLSEILDKELKDNYGNYCIENGEFFSDNGDNGGLIAELSDDDTGHEVFFLDTLEEADELFWNWVNGGGSGIMVVSLDTYMGKSKELAEIYLDPIYPDSGYGNVKVKEIPKALVAI